MLTQYKNIENILNAKTSTVGERFTDKIKTKFQYSSIPDILTRDVTTGIENDQIELHVYSGDTWITGNHRVQSKYKSTNDIRDSKNNKLINWNSNPVTIDLYNEFQNLNINSGKFRFVVNFNKNIIGNYDYQYLAIDEISDDRTELKLFFTDPLNTKFKTQLQSFITNVANGNQTKTRIVTPRGISTRRTTFRTFLLNFSRNKNYVFVNSVVVGDFIYVKLLDPLPEDIEDSFKCWIVQEQRPPYIDHVSITPYIAPKVFNKLASPNWYANANYNTSTETSLKNWNDLLGSSIQTSQQIVDSYFSGSLSGVTLNIDFSDFNNFVFYSSAEERVRNFRYKLELLEYYGNQSASLSLITSSVAQKNISDYDLRKSNLIGGFDAFEKFLYYESSSKLTNNNIPLESPNVANLTGSYITPVPKSNSIYPYINYSVSSSQFNNWYDVLLESASLYDTLNFNALRYAIPQFIRIDKNNVDLDLFVDMLGHHYDILYMYVKHMSKIHSREENPKLGMPNELLQTVAKQFGWNLTNGNQYQDLWQYVYGVNAAGSPTTGSNSVTGRSLSGQDMTYTIWRRIVNNLPLLLKSKGTKRSIKALLSCYGVPQSLITIQEYGGPRIERPPVYEKVNFDYALDLINNNSGTVTVNYNQKPNTVELRFRTDDVRSNPLLPNTMNLYTIGSNTVTIDYTLGTLGTIRINGTASANIEMFDGGWLNTMLRTSGNKLEIIAKRSKYGKIVAAVSASATASFSSTGTLTIGGTTAGSRLQGQLQELRFWTSSLSESAFNNHTKAPSAYNGNVDAYDELMLRYPLTQKFNHTISGSLIGVQPVYSPISASFTGWSSAEPYDSIEETYYFDAISLGAGTLDDNKIRIEDNVLVGKLDVKTRAEQSQYDKAPLDSNKLGVYFSPQTMINDDIIAQLGFTSLDDYIGDPGETEKQSYPRLIQKAHDYWKKYDEKNDINAYIKIFSLFDLSFFRQIEQLIPARVNQITGVLIQPNLLERSKDSLLPTLKRFDHTYQALIQDPTPVVESEQILYNTTINFDESLILSGQSIGYTGVISEQIYTISGYDDDQWIAYITSSAAKKYESTKYSHEYLYKSGSTYVTGSTPYWKKEAILPVISGSKISTFKKYKGNISSSFASPALYGFGVYSSSLYGSGILVQTGLTGSYAEIQDYLPTGLNNLWYAGCKLSSPAFNVNSNDTVDGGPVVEWTSTNANQLIYQNLGNAGSFKVQPGLNSNNTP